VLDGGPDPQGEGAISGENIAAHFKVMGHPTVSCAKTAEPIDMPFWMKTPVGPRNCVLERCIFPNGKGQFSGVVQAMQKHWKSSLQLSLRHVLCKRDHSVVNNVMVVQQKDHSVCQQARIGIWKIMSTGDLAYRLGWG